MTNIGDILYTAEDLDEVPEETVLIDNLEIDVYQAFRWPNETRARWTWIGRNPEYENVWYSDEMVRWNGPGFRVLWVPGQ